MWYYLVKLAVSAGLIVAVSEVAKRSATLGALTASLPLVSLLALVWLYLDTHDTAKVAELSRGVFWLVLPSLALFLALPALLYAGWGFGAALLAASVGTVALYLAELWLLPRLGIKL